MCGPTIFTKFVFVTLFFVCMPFVSKRGRCDSKCVSKTHEHQRKRFIITLMGRTWEWHTEQLIQFSLCYVVIHGGTEI